MSDRRSLKEELTASSAPRVHRTIVLGMIVGLVLILTSIIFREKPDPDIVKYVGRVGDKVLDHSEMPEGGERQQGAAAGEGVDDAGHDGS